MKYAENNRISHRQLRRQIVLAYLAPLLLCLTGRGGIQGIHGFLAAMLALAALLFYVIILIRLCPAFSDLEKTAGPFWGRLAAVFFLSYTILTGAVLLSVLEEILPMGLLIGIPGWETGLLAAVVCSVGIHKGIQRRGRMAEVTGGILLFCVLVMLAVALGQGEVSYLMDMARSFEFRWEALASQWYGCICAFAGIGLLPFSLEFVEKKSSAGRSVAAALLILAAVFGAVLFILPGVLGWERVQQERYPILPLLAGANLPGDVLARFDIVWLCFLLFGLLFAIGSLFFYGSHILQSAHMGKGRFYLAALSYLLSLNLVPGWRLRDFYSVYLARVFVPGMVLIQLLFLLKSRGRRLRAGAAASALLCLFLTGCAGVEPEKRLYPLAMAVDYEPDGTMKVTYAMADLQTDTGQEKAEESGFQSTITLRGNSFQEIREKYEKSQEKYLDLGHLQALILGRAALEPGKYEPVLQYLLEEPMTGEDLYLFVTDQVDQVMNYGPARQSSIGQYLKGIYENRPAGQTKEGVNLRKVYASWYKDGTLPVLPELVFDQEENRVYSP